MEYSRRNVVTGAASLAVLGLAGCNSQGSSDGSSNAGGSSSSGSGGGTSTATNGTSGTDTATATPALPPLVRDTATVYDEVSWFANQYNTAIYQYRSHVKAIGTMVSEARSKSELSASDVEAIRSRASTFSEYLRNEMAPHFPETDDIISNTEHYVGQVDKYRKRGDDTGLDSALATFERYYDGLSQDSFVRDRFSGRPVRKPLYTYLRAEGLGSNKPVFVFGDPANPSLRTCRLGSSWNFDLLAETDLGTEEVRAYLERLDVLFGGIHVPTGRTGRVFVESHTANGPRRLRPIYLQRYGDEAAAEAALSTALDSATSEGTTNDFGRPTWHRVFYTESVRMKFRDGGFALYDVDDDAVYGPSGAFVPETSRRHIFDKARIKRDQEPGRSVYAYLARVGRHLVAASPSTLAWGERPSGAENAIRNTWLWK